MINVNQITSQLARMPDQALQKYAMLNKNDPYTVSLALSESNRRKAMREGAVPQPGQMPKVVDQDIAQITAPVSQPQMPPQAQAPQQRLPEDSGIGQLPAQNMQHMADGGIVGYADTGLVKTYAINESITDPATGRTYTPAEINELLKTNPKATMDMIHKQSFVQNPPVFPKGNAGIQYGAPTDRMQQKFSGSQPGGNILPTTSGYEGMGIGQFLSSMKDKLSIDPLAPTNVRQTTYAPDSLPTTGTDNRALTPEEVRKLQISGGREQIGANENWGQINAAPGGKSEVVSTAPPTTPPKMPPRPGATTGANAANFTVPAQGGINALQQENDAIARFKANINKNTETEVNKTDYLKELGAISQPAYDKATAMVEKEKGRLKEGKEQDFYMALIEGGLAAASENGPNGIQNLAKGFSKGAASYRDGLKEFRKASQENAKMELELTRAEAADKKGDIKTYYDRIDKFKDRELTRDTAINQGIAQITNTGYSGQIQEKITHIKGGYDLQAEKMRNATSLAVASMPGANERLFSTLGGGDVAKGLEKYQAAQTDKTGLGFAKLYVDHVSESNKAGMTPMTEGVFLDTMTRLAAQFNPKTVTDPKQGNLYGRP